MSKRILVVEDQKDNRQIIRDMLAGTDYEITEAEDGEHALAAVAKRVRGSFVKKQNASATSGDPPFAWMFFMARSRPARTAEQSKN